MTERSSRGRYARELVRGLLELGFGGNLGLYGYTLGGKRYDQHELGLEGSAAELVRLRLPDAWIAKLLTRLGKGVDDLVGGCHVYHHLRPEAVAVRSAAQVATIFDCIASIPDSGYDDPQRAEREAQSLRQLAGRVQRVLVPSEFVGAEVVMSLGVSPAQISVTQLGCDHMARVVPPEGFPSPSSPYILTVARVAPRKNHLRMLEAFELLVREGLPQHWIIAGERGHDWRSFARALENSPARERVHWMRRFDDRELARLYAQADVMLWPSLNEGFGLPPLESMACGTAVVASGVTSMPEILGDAAFLVEPTDSERIFEATRRLLAEPDLREEHELRGKRKAREYTWRECAKHTMLAYQAAGDDSKEEPKMQGLF